jgi:cysteine desulfurase
MGVACRIAVEEGDEDRARITALRERLWQGLATLPGVTLNGHPAQRAPGILSVTVDGVEGESLLYALPGFAVASGSACATTSAEPSYVLRALGRSDRLAQSTLRLSLGRYTTSGEIEQAVQAIRAAVERLRAVAPPGKAT